MIGSLIKESDLELLRLRFPERIKDYKAICFIGPFTQEEYRWAGIDCEPMSPGIENWCFMLRSKSEKTLLKAYKQFLLDNRPKEYGGTRSL